jgi:hypothetical protein
MDLLSNRDSDNADGIDWPLNFENELSTWTGMDGCYMYTDNGTNADANLMENLLQSSFDTWAALEGTFQQPIDMETVW